MNAPPAHERAARPARARRRLRLTQFVKRGVLLVLFVVSAAPAVARAQGGPIYICVVDDDKRKECKDGEDRGMSDVQITIHDEVEHENVRLPYAYFDAAGIYIYPNPESGSKYKIRAFRQGDYYYEGTARAKARQKPVMTTPRPIAISKYPAGSSLPRTGPPRGDAAAAQTVIVRLVKVASYQTPTARQQKDAGVGADKQKDEKADAPQTTGPEDRCIQFVSGSPSRATGAQRGASEPEPKKLRGAHIVASLVARGSEGQDISVGVRDDSLTDGEGKFCLKPDLDGTYQLMVFADDHITKALVLIAKSGTVELYDEDGSRNSSLRIEMESETREMELAEAFEEASGIGDYSRQQIFSDPFVEYLPLPGVRRLDSLALLVPGVLPPPESVGGVGPGVSGGVGASGQFSANGLRSRENNFTVDNSDNNDEEVGARRQGYFSLSPQSVESVAEVQVITALGDVRFGRNFGGQVNTVTKSGEYGFHGSLYGFLTDDGLNARDFFDSDARGAANVLRRSSDGSPVTLDGQPLAPSTPAGGENKLTRGQGGFAVGGRVPRTKWFFFHSFERQEEDSERESHFAVPTVAERGLFGSGETGLSPGGSAVFPASLPGNALFSLYPFPNNPGGPYGGNTYTAVLPSGGRGTLFSSKLTRQLVGDGKPAEGPWYKGLFRNFLQAGNYFSGRYSFTQDSRTLPATGGAVFSALRPHVRTQNVALHLTRVLGPGASDLLRFSYGRTNLSFPEVRDPFLSPSSLFPGTRFLLNAPLLLNVTSPGGPAGYVSASSPAGQTLLSALGMGGVTQTEQVTGPLGQVSVAGFSPLGVDVYNFPQWRANNTTQFGDTITLVKGGNIWTLGADVRKANINTEQDRNFRPLASFNGVASGSALTLTRPDGSAVPQARLGGATLAAAGVPTGLFHTLAVEPNSSLGIRYSQVNLFAQLARRVAHNLQLTWGVRYELNTVPDTVGRRLRGHSTPRSLRGRPRRRWPPAARRR